MSELGCDVISSLILWPARLANARCLTPRSVTSIQRFHPHNLTKCREIAVNAQTKRTMSNEHGPLGQELRNCCYASSLYLYAPQRFRFSRLKDRDRRNSISLSLHHT